MRSHEEWSKDGQVRSHQPGNRRDGQGVSGDLRRGPRGGDRRGRRSPPQLGADDLGRRARRAGQEGRRVPQRAPRGAGRDHRARDGQADGAGAGRGRLLRRHLRLLRRPRGGTARRRADRAAGRRRHGPGPQVVGWAPAGDHAVELPLLPGGPLRRPEPRGRQHDPAEAGASVPGVGRGDPEDDGRRRLPRRRLPDDPRLERADREGDRGSARAGRLADRLRAGRRRGRRDRRAQPEEGRARARRLGSVHPPRRRGHRRGRRRRGRRAPRQHRASPATRRSGSSSPTSSTTTSSRSSARR